MVKERIVYIRRVEGNDKTRLPKDVLIDAKTPIGASFNEFGQVLKGVTGKEEQDIMPSIIGISTSDPTFAKKIETFWFNLSINVPYQMGVKLNVSLNEDGTPVAPLDYVKYKFAVKHRDVAFEEDLENKPGAVFFVHDPATASEKRAKGLKIRNEAKLKYLELIQDDKKIDAVFTVVTSYRNPAMFSSEDKQVKLEEAMLKAPEKFLEVVKDENLVMRSFIFRCVDAGVFAQSGNRIMFDGAILGEDMDSSIAYLKSTKGSKDYVSAEGKLNQWQIKKDKI